MTNGPGNGDSNILDVLERCGEVINELNRTNKELEARAHHAERLLKDLVKLRPAEEYDEDMGDVLWWYVKDGRIEEPPYVGSPNHLGHEVVVQPSITLHIATGEYEGKDDPSSDDLTSKPHKFFVGGWPGYHTHFTPLPRVKPCLT